MEVSNQVQRDEPVVYTTCRRVQVWFLQRSRRNWKRKYQELKGEAKRLLNRVSDVTKSREKWREQAERNRQQLDALAAENARLKAMLEAVPEAAEKKGALSR